MIRALFTAGMTRVAGMAAGLVNAALLVSYLAPDEVGQFFVMLSTAMVAGVVGSLGLGDAMLPCIEARRSQGRDPDAVAAAGLGMAAILAGVTAALLAVALLLGPGDWRPLGGAAVVTSVLSAVTVFEIVLMHYFRTRDAFTVATLFQVSQGRNILFAAGLGLLVVLGGPAETRLSAVQITIVVCAALPVLIALATTVPRLRPCGLGSVLAEIPRLARTGIGFFPSTALILSLPHLLILITASVAGPLAVAVFGLAQRIAGACGIANMAANTTFVRATRRFLAGDEAGAKTDFTRFMMLTAGATGVIAVAYGVIGIHLVDLIVSPDAYPWLHLVVAILLMGQIVTSVLGFSAMFLRNLGHAQSIAIATAMAAPVSLPLAVLLSWAFGAPGTAVASLIQVAVVGGLTSRDLRRRHGLPDVRPSHLVQIWGELVHDINRYIARFQRRT